MKKFVLSIAILISGVLLTCAAIIAEGLRVCGNNASMPGLYETLFCSNNTESSTVLLLSGIVIACIGLVLSMVFIWKDKNHG